MKQKRLHKKFPAFTLIELIIVITILAILATIAFVSYNNYVSQTRDTSKIASLKNIELSLRGFQVQSGKYPLPDNLVTLTSSLTIIGYQGVIGDNLKSILKISGNQDGKYAISDNGRYFQLLDFLENNGISFQKISTTVQAKNTYGYNLGDTLGIIVDDNNQNPSISQFDVLTGSHLNQNYKIYFSNNDVKSGTGKDILKILEYGGRNAYGLLGYWDFDKNFGDTSVTANLTLSSQKEVTFQDLTNFSYQLGKKGNAISFTGASQTGLILPLGAEYGNFSEGMTLSFFSKTIPGRYNQASLAYISIGNLWLHLYSGVGPEDTHVRFIPYDLHQKNLAGLQDSVNPFYSFLRFGITSPSVITPTYLDNQFHLHTISFNNWGKMRYYIDNNLVYKNDYQIGTYGQQFIFSGSVLAGNEAYANQKVVENTIISGTPSKSTSNFYLQKYKDTSLYHPNNITIGTNGYGLMDELRIYNRMLDDDEILNLYDKLK